MSALRNEGRAFALRVVNDPLFQSNMLKRAQHGLLLPVEAQWLLHTAWGKPVDEVHLRVENEFVNMSLPELAAKAKVLEQFLSEAAANESVNERVANDRMIEGQSYVAH